MVKGILFSYWLLTSLCIKAALDNNIPQSIDIDMKKEKWLFMLVPNNPASGHLEEVCYMLMIDKGISEDPSINKLISTTLIDLQDNNIEEILHVNNCQNLTLCSMRYLLEEDANNFLRVLKSEQKNYKYALVVIFFTITENNKEIGFKIEQIELNNTIYANDQILNGTSSGLNILKPLLASCKEMRFASKNSPQISSDETPNFDLYLNIESNINNTQCPDIENQLFTSLEDIESVDENISDAYNTVPNINLLLSNTGAETCPNYNTLLNPYKDIAPNVSECEKPNNTKHPKGRIYTCNICNKVFTRIYNLHSHIKVHRDKSIFHCHECDKDFTNRQILNRHMLFHLSDKAFQCPWCSNVFYKAQTFNIHMETHTDKDTFKCQECGKYFISNTILQLHISIHLDEKPFKCHLCSKAFNQRCNLKTHMRTHKNVSECEKLNKTTLPKEKNHHCNICNKSFTRSYNLHNHIKVHEKKSIFHCHECDKYFSTRQIFTRHMLFHLSEKTFQCPWCRNVFNRTQDLDTHMEIHTDKSTFKCQECGKYFTSKMILESHRYIHSGGKPFKCHLCNKEFTRKGNLKAHFRTHNNKV